MNYEIFSLKQTMEMYVYNSDEYLRARNALHNSSAVIVLVRKDGTNISYMLISRKKINLSNSLPFIEADHSNFSERKLFAGHNNVWSATFYNAHDLMCAASKKLKNFLFFNMNSL